MTGNPETPSQTAGAPVELSDAQLDAVQGGSKKKKKPVKKPTSTLPSLSEIVVTKDMDIATS